MKKYDLLYKAHVSYVSYTFIFNFFTESVISWKEKTSAGTLTRKTKVVNSKSNISQKRPLLEIQYPISKTKVLGGVQPPRAFGKKLKR